MEIALVPRYYFRGTAVVPDRYPRHEPSPGVNLSG